MVHSDQVLRWPVTVGSMAPPGNQTLLAIGPHKPRRLLTKSDHAMFMPKQRSNQSNRENASKIRSAHLKLHKFGLKPFKNCAWSSQAFKSGTRTLKMWMKSLNTGSYMICLYIHKYFFIKIHENTWDVKVCRNDEANLVFTHVLDHPNRFGCVIGVPGGRCWIFSFASKIEQDCRITTPICLLNSLQLVADSSSKCPKACDFGFSQGDFVMKYGLLSKTLRPTFEHPWVHAGTTV